MPTATLPELELKPTRRPTGGGRGFGGDDGGHGGRGNNHRNAPAPINRYRLGLLFALGAIVMMFVAFTSAYIYRQGLSFDWKPLQAPPVLWFNTAVLLASSLTLELARRALKRDGFTSFEGWVTATTLLGITFLAGQYLAWRELAARGVYLATNPHSSFFYLLTGAHAFHLIGGIVALAYVMSGALRHRYTPLEHTAVDVTATYWHFMDGLWIYLFLLLFLWR